MSSLILPVGFDLDAASEIYNETVVLTENIDPSFWYERKKILMPSSAAVPGYVDYCNTPYYREIVNCFSPYHPAIDVTVMGPAQDGKTFMVLEPIIGYVIEMCPGNILHLTGNSELSPDAGLRIDQMIDNCKIRYLIKPSTNQLRNSRTGDTSIRKEFAGNCVYRVNSITKKNALRQNDIYLLIIDDTDAAKMTDPKVGDLRKTAKLRTAAYEWKCKRLYISSPEMLNGSFINASYELSDKRIFLTPCQSCHELINLQFIIKIDNENYAGMNWKVDNFGRVIPSSVHYVCQKCGNGFAEKDKLRWMNEGRWNPTCEPKELHHYGYHKNGLLKPPGMKGWTSVITDYILCHPPGKARIEADYKVWKNSVMAEPYEDPGMSPQATDLMKNCRSYEIGVVPESVSEADGNEDIIILTAAFDCNGTENDARIDYEIKAYSRKQASYSIKYGSCGGFIAHQSAEQKANDPRIRYTYKRHSPNSVWKLVDEVLGGRYPVDTGGYMTISAAAIDIGYLTDIVCDYIDNSNHKIIGVMGEKEYDYVLYQQGLKTFKPLAGRNKSWSLNVNMIKDDVAGRMVLNWDKKIDECQPHLYMNYPQYTYDGYFNQLESEHKVEKMVGRSLKFMWQKKGPTAQNHYWDCIVYNVAVIDILLDQLFKKAKKDNYSWQDLCDLIPKKARKTR